VRPYPGHEIRVAFQFRARFQYTTISALVDVVYVDFQFQCHVVEAGDPLERVGQPHLLVVGKRYGAVQKDDEPGAGVLDECLPVHGLFVLYALLEQAADVLEHAIGHVLVDRRLMLRDDDQAAVYQEGKVVLPRRPQGFAQGVHDDLGVPGIVACAVHGVVEGQGRFLVAKNRSEKAVFVGHRSA